MNINSVLRGLFTVSSILGAALHSGLGAAIRGVQNNAEGLLTNSTIMPVRTLPGRFNNTSPVMETMGCLTKTVTTTDDIRCSISSSGDKTVVLKLSTDRYVSIKADQSIPCPVTPPNGNQTTPTWPSLNSFDAMEVTPGTINKVEFSLVSSLLLPDASSKGSENLLQVKNYGKAKRFLVMKTGYIRINPNDSIVFSNLKNTEITVSRNKPTDKQRIDFSGMYQGGLKIYDS